MASEDRELISFMALAYIFSWSITIPLVLSSRGIIQIHLPSSLTIIASFGPTIAAIVLVAREKGASSVYQFLKNNLKPKVKMVWVLFAILGPGLVGVLSVFLGAFVRRTPPNFMWASNLSTFPIIFLFVFLFGGPLGEEYGWRGYALPRMLRLGWLKSNLLLGLCWGLWHLPLFWIVGTPQSEITLIGFMLQIMGNTFIYSWLMQGTEGSIFTAMLFHASGNSFAGIIPFLPLSQTGGDIYVFSVFIALIWLVAMIISVKRLRE